MQDKYEIFADNALLNIFNGALVSQLDKETNHLQQYRVIGYRLQSLEVKTVTVTAKSSKDEKGIYSATVYLYGVRRKGKARSFFFPEHWTKDEVINAIFEAYQNKILKNGEERLYEGETSDNLKIKLWLDRLGKVIDAMPVRGKCLPAGKTEKVKKKRVCGICGQSKHTVCLTHHPFPPRTDFEKFRKKIRYLYRKIYYSILKSGRGH